MSTSDPQLNETVVACNEVLRVLNYSFDNQVGDDASKDARRAVHRPAGLAAGPRPDDGPAARN